MHFKKDTINFTAPKYGYTTATNNVCTEVKLFLCIAATSSAHQLIFQLALIQIALW